MAENPGIRVVHLQRLQQGVQGCLLFPGPRVGVIAVLIKSALIAEANRVLVVVAGVRPWQILVPRLVHLSVAGNIVVVAGEPEAGVVAGNQTNSFTKVSHPETLLKTRN